MLNYNERVTNPRQEGTNENAKGERQCMPPGGGEQASTGILKQVRADKVIPCGTNL